MPLRFTFRQLEYFVAVGELGSVAQAAERMNVSPPSISTSISQLEAELGLQLFVRRHAQGVSPTPAGARLLAEARALIKRAEGLTALAGDLADAVSGPLNLGCLQTFAPMILAQLRRGFEEQYAAVALRQVEGDHAMLLAGLRGATLDICVTYDLDIPTDVCFEPLATLPAYVMLPADHRLAGRAEIAPADLAEEPMVLLDLPISADYFLSMLRDVGLTPRIVERTRDLSLLRSMVANGFGFGLANFRPRTELAPDGEPLKFAPLAGGARPLRLGLATSRSARKTRVLLAFEAHCRDAISATSIPGATV